VAARAADQLRYGRRHERASYELTKKTKEV
jgi:hypothetical protein